MAQLAELGVAVPQEYRGEMALASEWQVVSETVISPRSKEEDDAEDDEEDDKDVSFARSKRKRREQDDDERGEDERSTRRKGWGSTIKTYPGSGSVDADLESLLGSNKTRGEPGFTEDISNASKQDEPNTEDGRVNDSRPDQMEREDFPAIKREPSDGQSRLSSALAETDQTPDIKAEPEPQAQEGGVLFKKRKAKNIRQR